MLSSHAQAATLRLGKGRAALQCIDCIQQDGATDLPPGCEAVVLVNNLGSTPVMEMYIAARAALRYVQDKYKVSHCHCCVLRRGMTCSVS